MIRDLSAADLSDLRQLVTHWWQTHVSVSDLAEAEHVVQAVSRELAQAMLEAAMRPLTGRATYQGCRQQCVCGEWARFVSYRSRWVRTLCGEVQVARAYYHCRACARGWLTWDGAQGLDERLWSPAVKALGVELAARLPYREAVCLLGRILGWTMEESSLEELVNEVGGRLRAHDREDARCCFEDSEPTEPAGAGEPIERLYISMDAGKAHTGGAWHDIKVGAVYAGRPGTDGADQATEQCYEAAEEGCEAFGRRLYLRARKSGLERARQVIVVGDGAEWIWNQANEQFGGCLEILDYYHACEHIWRLSHVLYGEGHPHGQRWARQHCHTLKRSGPASFLRAIKRRVPKTPPEREALRLEQGYFLSHRRRMRYAAFQRAGLMIGSGPVEAACKVVVGQRLKGAGMRWTHTGADAILAVRTAVLNGEQGRLGRLAWAA